ncbi:MAG: STAS domain-containing protein [Eubacteriales bacterium]|nr:STAS domain-containing protein [Eubacteriales bacterium]
MQDGTGLTMEINGRLDTNAAPKLIEEINDSLVDGIESFVLDMKNCDYVASSGLRAILNAQKKMNALHGTMVVKNVINDVMEVFEMTGFADILTFE